MGRTTEREREELAGGVRKVRNQQKRFEEERKLLAVTPIIFLKDRVWGYSF